MGDLTYLIIFLVVINIVGRIFRALQKSAGQQAPGTKPKSRQKTKSKGPFEMLAQRLEELGEMQKERPAQEESLPHPYADSAVEGLQPEVSSAETPQDFSLETATTTEAKFESMPRKELHAESFPWQDTERYEYSPPVKPVTPALGPEQDYARSYRIDVVNMLRDREGLRNAVLLQTILGPCRAREGRYRFRGPR